MNWKEHWTQHDALSRRDFLSFASNGLGAVAAAGLVSNTLGVTGARTHFAPKAKRVVHVVMCGGFSQVDSFDYKPALERNHGKSLQAAQRPDVFFGKVGLLRKSDWAFKQRGQSGLWISDLFPHLAGMADELCVVRSMFAETSNHTPATFQENTGFRLNGFPVMGSWISYGLGAQTDNLPAFVTLPDTRGVPAGGSINWTNGFLPARHQGVTMRVEGTPIDDLQPAQPIAPKTDRATRSVLAALNARHLHARAGEDVLAARLKSHELAARMQLAVPEVAALEAESAATRSLYGLGNGPTNDFGRACLMTRRLLERGVRFVQLFSGGAFGSPRINWDGHEDMVKNHGREAKRMDQPLATLIADLRQRGMLDDTLILCTSEFGRTPFTQSAANQVGKGRDHNQEGFTIFMAGGGLKRGFAHGESDDVGYQAVHNRIHWHDLHATVLHLLGIDHEQLTFYHNGVQRRLTNVHGNVIKDIIS